MLIFDNDKHYQNLIDNGFEKYLNKRDLIILCEHWLEDGLPFNSLKDNIINYCFTWNNQFNEAQNENLILSVIKQVKQNIENGKPFENKKNIIFYKSELDTLLGIKNKKLQRVLFIMISLAKWRNANYIYLNSGSSIKLKDIFSLANIKCTKKEQMMCLHELNENGYIDVQLKPLLKFIIPCIVENGEVALSFDISDNMLDELLNITLPHCERCGKPFEKQNNKQKYCKECAKIVKNEQNKSYLQKGK